MLNAFSIYLYPRHNFGIGIGIFISNSTTLVYSVVYPWYIYTTFGINIPCTTLYHLPQASTIYRRHLPSTAGIYHLPQTSTIYRLPLLWHGRGGRQRQQDSLLPSWPGLQCTITRGPRYWPGHWRMMLRTRKWMRKRRWCGKLMMLDSAMMMRVPKQSPKAP